MTWRLVDENGALLDAALDLKAEEIVLHSRGGSRGGENARNLDYVKSLQLLLTRLRASGLGLEGVWLDSEGVQMLAREKRSLLDPSERDLDPMTQFSRISRRMQAFGRPDGAPYGGSRVKRIRLRTAEVVGFEEIVAKLGLRAMDGGAAPRRLSARALQAVTAEHLWSAVQKLAQAPDDHPFGPSRGFDLVMEDGVRLAPKAVFGLAAAEALGFSVGPEHFSGGVASQSQRALVAAGFLVRPRGELSVAAALPLSGEERIWAEGRPRLVSHLRRERAGGLSQAKKKRFLREHGVLRCERCGLDPIAVYGSETGAACIEVHHAATHVSEMEPFHQTRLDDLECLCANCHRVEHALMGRNQPAVSS